MTKKIGHQKFKTADAQTDSAQKPFTPKALHLSAKISDDLF